MTGTELIHAYFKKLNRHQIENFGRLQGIYSVWNERINVISRKDMDNFYIHHVLHSLSIAEFISFNPGASVLDLGTGGGFPGIPLAILFPDTHFTLADSVGKKIQVVQAVASELGLGNVKAIHSRAELLPPGQFDFVVTRAVAPMRNLIEWSRPLFCKKDTHPVPNGIIALKGGNLKEELTGIRCEVFDIADWFSEEYFETKKLVYWHPSGKAHGKRNR